MTLAGHQIGGNVSIDTETANLVRGVCNDDPSWTLKSFVTCAIREKIKRDRLTPKPASTMRRGRPPVKKAEKKR